ncbi:cell division topological specificity factor MinE [Tengunoibacter tsumagoiensis]|uniref:Cell division topological specificity factor n=1 Tax=Tengunoibacter tsumagoiensis TaxID=2014871 RepID=A0A401ZTG4_9CHLR|nr:cell division topological specificity factor MinE [Tengunoibacter tsumagoiensis]GCE10157.1 cell division topological specificity factor [Tengunoibacter tsumagoiensis]
MSVFEFMVGRKKPTPGEVAKERLKVVLSYDRLKLNPELLEIIREEILSVVSRRLEIDAEQMQVNLSHNGELDFLLANMPIKREKVSFDWDPPAYSPPSHVLHGTIHVEEGMPGTLTND